MNDAYFMQLQLPTNNVKQIEETYDRMRWQSLAK